MIGERYCRVVPIVQVVIVAYQRRELLRESLTAIGAQTRPVEVIHVVDNASTDGTAAMVREHFPHVVLHELAGNTGGAGGFAAGLAYALDDGADLVWLMDDDTVPRPDALAALLDTRDRYPGPVPALVASRVLWTDGRDHPMNTPREKPRVSAAERGAAAVVGGVAIRSASFVSVLVDAPVVRRVGLPEADFFLWNDDFEFTTRLLRQRPGVWCRASVVEHRTKAFGSTDADPGERFYFEVRNKLWTFLRSDGLAPTEKVVYFGSTARRWARTFAGSRDRATLARGFGRGVADGLRRGPRSTRMVLTEAGVGLPDARRGSGVRAGTTEFSLLLPVYERDDPAHFRRAFSSSVDEQTRPPTEVVLVRDGPVPTDLAAALDAAAAESAVPVTRVDLAANVGLAEALEAGLRACRFDVVARMDADDVSLPERFAVQLPVIESGADLVGAALEEFHSDEDDVVGLRRQPTDPHQIRSRARFHDPFNHPTVVFRKSAVAAAGGYLALPLMEDYWLFARMIQSGAQVANVPQPLVKYRVGAGAYARRGGWDLVRSEATLQGHLRRSGFVTGPQYLRNLAVRGGYRLVPESMRRAAYRRLFARHRQA